MKRFHVFSNFAVSMDGKISTKDRDHIKPSRVDAYLMDWHRSRAAAILVGAETMRAYGNALTVKQPQHKALRRVKRLSPQPLNIILSASLDFDLNTPFFKSTAVQRLIFCPAHSDKKKIQQLSSMCKVETFEKHESYPQVLISYLIRNGFRNLLIEGGGSIMFDWAKNNLIDEWNITFVPKVIGGSNAPTMVEGEGFAFKDVLAFRLKKCRKVGDEIFTQYTRR